MRIALIGLLLLFTSCAHINKFSTWQRENFERGAYQDAIYILEAAVPEHILNQCGYKFNAPIPPTIVLSAEELEEKYGSPVNGLYSQTTVTVYYLKEEWDTLTHEYIHYLNDISNKKEGCFDQVIAYLGVYAFKQKKAATRWNREYRKLKTRNIGR